MNEKLETLLLAIVLLLIIAAFTTVEISQGNPQIHFTLPTQQIKVVPAN